MCHRYQPTRLPRPWDSPGKNTGVGCRFLLQCVKLKKVKVKLLSRVRLLATPGTSAYKAPPSMGFSRQKNWSGVPLPSRSQLPRDTEISRQLRNQKTLGTIIRDPGLLPLGVPGFHNPRPDFQEPRNLGPQTPRPLETLSSMVNSIHSIWRFGRLVPYVCQ